MLFSFLKKMTREQDLFGPMWWQNMCLGLEKLFDLSSQNREITDNNIKEKVCDVLEVINLERVVASRPLQSKQLRGILRECSVDLQG